jgi:heme exporter protein A
MLVCARFVSMVIKLNDLVCYANENPVCKPVTLVADSGSLVVVEGPNGAGKSTMLRALSGIVTNITGKIELQAKACYIGHELCLHDNLTVMENLQAMALLECPSHNEVKQLVDTILLTMRLMPKKNHYPWQLSKGQKHKLNLAKLLFTPNPIWLLDEPLVHLDLHTQKFLLELLQKHLQNNLAVVVITSHTPIMIPCNKVITLKMH